LAAALGYRLWGCVAQPSTDEIHPKKWMPEAAPAPVDMIVVGTIRREWAKRYRAIPYPPLLAYTSC
jgi:hypothetical protein